MDRPETQVFEGLLSLATAPESEASEAEADNRGSLDGLGNTATSQRELTTNFTSRILGGEDVDVQVAEEQLLVPDGTEAHDTVEDARGGARDQGRDREISELRTIGASSSVVQTSSGRRTGEVVVENVVDRQPEGSLAEVDQTGSSGERSSRSGDSRNLVTRATSPAHEVDSEKSSVRRDSAGNSSPKDEYFFHDLRFNFEFRLVHSHQLLRPFQPKAALGSTENRKKFRFSLMLKNCGEIASRFEGPCLFRKPSALLYLLTPASQMPMNKSFPVGRRQFLRGLGTLMALPALESITPLKGLAETSASTGSAGAAALPRRMAFIYVPNGVNMADWTPKTVGGDFDLPAILEPLAGLKSEFSVLSGLTQDAGRAKMDGAGDHARASATWLTSTRIRKTNGVDIHAGVSVDQVAAQRLGRETRFASLELGCDRGQTSGNCDSGYSCAYSFNVAWRTPSSPLPPEVDPALAFERLFASANPEETLERRIRRERTERSILDFVLEDARSLNAKLGKTDQRKLDEYLTSVRDLERRIDLARNVGKDLPGFQKPTGIPKNDRNRPDFQPHSRLMLDILALAFQTDTTRVATFVMKHDGSDEPYPQIGVPEGHHTLSHHQNDPEKKAKIAKINRFHMEQYAYFLNKLRSIREGSGTLLDQSMILYGSGLADGNAHAHENLPVLLAGRGGGTIQPGRHVRVPKETPMANLFLSMLDRMGVGAERFGDSTGRLSQLTS